ncbi:unnamed protein product [Strongylus vulgaris]|uniref:Uncharacterized protein n=1 Tax=Strongylus vulgaris TaxID=40348 RepID=A0A3P7J9D5_STRVU|nr:unnamed protein product [Strongylus vulgaris]
MIPAIVVEGIFASIYVNDYENVQRPWISYMVDGSSILLSAIYYLLVQLGYSVLRLVLITFGIITFSSLTIMVFYRRDIARLRDISKTGNSTLTYTLSMKFQFAENVRVTKVSP